MKYQTSLRWLAAIVLVANILVAPAAAAQTSTPPLLYYFDTGHSIQYPFSTYFSERGGVERFGFPITEAFTDPQSGLLVQYFQKARLESHPANPDPYKVQLGLLGDELGRRQPPLAVKDIPSPSDPTCHYFPETGHKACFQFLEYWVANGGLDMFGYPIGENTLETGRIVQYFQRARFEWQPERPENQRVQTSPLGQIFFDYVRLDPSLLTPIPSPFSSTPQPIELRASASVKDTVIARGSTQTTTVVVTDQLRRPLARAAVTLIVHFPSGDQSFTLPPTDAQGKSTAQFLAGKFKPGTIITMDFIIAAYGLGTTTRTSYIVWYY